MKKLLFLIATLFLSISLMGQTKDTTKMSNYEKYVLAKEQGVQDTIFKTDTVYLNTKSEKPEYDDLYFTAKKNELRNKAKELRIERRKLNILQDSLNMETNSYTYGSPFDYYPYYDYRFRLYFGFRPFYYDWYNPFFYDPWYWNSPFYYGFEFGYDNWYFNWGWNYPIYRHWDLHTRFDNDHYRNRPPDFIHHQKPYTQPITVNRTVQIDKRTGQVLNVQNQGQRRLSTSTNSYSINNKRMYQPNNSTINGVNQNQNRRATVSSQTQNKSAYNQSQRKYTPSYDKPRMDVRPIFNNSRVNQPIQRSISAPMRSISTPMRSIGSSVGGSVGHIGRR